MRKRNIHIFLLFFITVTSLAQTKIEQEVLQISKDKWQWMADKDVEKLEKLFNDKSKFLYVSDT